MIKTILGLTFLAISLFGIENYSPYPRQFWSDGTLYLVTRRFEQNHQPFYLIVNTKTLQTKITSLDEALLQPVDHAFEQTLFAKRLTESTQKSFKGGATHAFTAVPQAIYLTMDLCPSSKQGYEEAFVEQLTRENGKTPIAVAISSSWIEHHEKAFDALKNNPKLELTWVNHTHTHFYNRFLKDRENFMLYPNTDIKEEILGLEKTLIERGITPSVFFRFPGLMANDTLMKELKQTYFLIPLSANAWIAKNEKVKLGSFILVHGNKNEPQGIEMLEQMLPDLLKRYRFHTIQEAFVP
jgi:peptidoglycan/xylan/chitin deacetylase (PgdA/CDA1 family)